jgi:hypothetical protein
MDFEKLHVTIGNPIPSTEGFTKLYLRSDPQDTEGLLGFVALAPSVPRWMSPYFATALQRHNDHVPGADLNLYSHDWFEKIVYVPEDQVKKKELLDPLILAQTLVSHTLSTGCHTVSAITRIQAATQDSQNPAQLKPIVRVEDQYPYYAIVWEHHKGDLTLMESIVVTTLDKVPNFVKDKIHVKRLEECYKLRNDAVVNGAIPNLRTDVFNSIRACVHAP